MRRDWQFFGELDADEDFIGHDRDEVRQLLLDMEATIHQIGGVMTMSAVRQQTGDDTYVTTGMLVSYDSFSPAARKPIEPSGDVVDGVQVPDAPPSEPDEIPPVEDAAT